MGTVGTKAAGRLVGRRRPVGWGAVAGLLLLLVGASPSTLHGEEEPAYDVPVPEPITLSGSGKLQSRPLDVIEGTLVLRITCQTPSDASGLFISLRQDNNLDGTFCGSRDGYCGSVYGAGYGAIKDLDTTLRYSKFYYGGRITLFIDGPSRGQWSVTVSQEPSPRHRFAGQVRDARSQTGFIRGAQVTATDARGNVFTAVTASDGRYNLPVFGFTDYDVTIRAPGYALWKGKVLRKAFLALGFPGWAVSLDALLAVAPPGPRIECLVRDGRTKKPLRAQVVCRDGSGRDVDVGPTDAEGLVVFESLEEGAYT
ncbi:MAG: carboxypeptidase regulatory-like domain-containing protein, partial [Planctomycetota bacterium]